MPLQISCRCAPCQTRARPPSRSDQSHNHLPGQIGATANHHVRLELQSPTRSDQGYSHPPPTYCNTSEAAACSQRGPEPGRARQHGAPHTTPDPKHGTPLLPQPSKTSKALQPRRTRRSGASASRCGAPEAWSYKMCRMARVKSTRSPSHSSWGQSQQAVAAGSSSRVRGVGCGV